MIESSPGGHPRRVERARPVDYRQRALALWPRLDPDALRRCHDDPDRLASLIARRTTLEPEAIRRILERPDASVNDDDRSLWFG